MTQWAEESDRGRDRGPVAVVRAWAAILGRPRQFFREKVAPGDQAPGLTFAGAVVLAAESTRMATVEAAYPVVNGQPTLSAILWLLFVTVLVAPAGIHLVAALQTIILIGTVEDRAGVSETVQVICYSFAPCVLAGVPSPWVQSAVVLWGAGLLVVGIATVHDIRVWEAVPVVAVPAVLVYGYGFAGTGAVLEGGELLYAALEDVLDGL